jgi:hypothetical protein
MSPLSIERKQDHRSYLNFYYFVFAWEKLLSENKAAPVLLAQ